MGNGNHAVARWLAERWGVVTADPAGCWSYPRPLHPSGYVRVSLDDKDVSLARVVWAMCHPGEPLGARHVRHSCGRPRCLAPHHLVVRPTSPAASRGGRRRLRKLTAAQVRTLRQAYERGHGVSKQLAARYGVSVSGAWRAATRRHGESAQHRG